MSERNTDAAGEPESGEGGRETPCRQLLRVVRGNPAPEELAALSALLFARLSAPEAEAAGPLGRAVAGWRRPERGSMFDGPRTWRGTGSAAHPTGGR
ncbi:acyl-CoA carboxylase epsilon subunit [Streptomyces physcomitrii]|uniref:Acyl-CoA carboxylase subunit epsilon n=1 Tax=Streptomyces physcomitrii TaxID=2724184 RepID=A0ABX1H5Y3_9ACTN|nr:acyl-CoA carboxylase epsilon subunit [Streptomyces physcomitrii]NKI42644.1 acyl-CoA carboxylase subunit epsilon [Streptomyces physcomitrii]